MDERRRVVQDCPAKLASTNISKDVSKENMIRYHN